MCVLLLVGELQNLSRVNGITGKVIEALDLRVSVSVSELFLCDSPKAVAALYGVCPAVRRCSAANVGSVYPAVYGTAASADCYKVVRVLALSGLVNLRDLCRAGLAGRAAGCVCAGIMSAAREIHHVAYLEAAGCRGRGLRLCRSRGCCGPALGFLTLRGS